MNYLGWPYRGYIKTAKNGDFCEELFSESDFETVLANFCCYDHGPKASEKASIKASSKTISNDEELCETFNQFFSNVVPTLNIPKPKSFPMASDNLDPIMSVIKSLTNTRV